MKGNLTTHGDFPMKNLILGVLVVLVGCAAVLPLATTGGSKADGTVVLTTQFNHFQKPSNPDVLVTEDAHQQALRRCAAWNYTGAERFDAVRTRCIQPTGFGGCQMYEASIVYQCTGGK
jgi:hypothetical protein